MNNSTSSTENPCLSIEAINKLCEEMKKMKHPLEEFANQHGFSLEDGDIMLIPISAKNEFDMILPKNCHFDNNVTDIVFIKSSFIKFGGHNFQI